MKQIIYPQGDGLPIAVVTPHNPGESIHAVAASAVPHGVPYLIVDETDFPATRDYRDAWSADFSHPDGYGG